MSDRVLVPLPDGSWLLMPMNEFTDALSAGSSLAAPPKPAEQPIVTEPLKDSSGIAELLGCHDTLVEQMARDKRIPSVRIGRLLRFEPAAVLAALRGLGSSQLP